MSIAAMIITILGLALFEVVSSIDNAIINAEVLGTMRKKARKWFLLWGMLFAVFLVRGLLPWFIVWITVPSLGPIGALSATFSRDPKVHTAMEQAAPVLLIGGGVFLIFLFCHWLFLEEKKTLFPYEPFFIKHGGWFFAAVSLLLTVIVWFAIKKNPMMAFSAVIGSSAYFITHGFKQHAEVQEQNLMRSKISDISKILYLEAIDFTFSIDGVLGAFAFTLSVPLILLGNGIGAFVVREFTVGNIERIKRFPYLKNGAMYSILVLGMVMLLDSFGAHIPSFISPCCTFVIVGFFFWKSLPESKKKSTRKVQKNRVIKKIK